MLARTVEDIRAELDWLEINALVFDDDINQWLRIEARRKEVVAELYEMFTPAKAKGPDNGR